MKNIIWAVLLIILAAAVDVSAGAPNLLTYQGRLKEGGQAVNGNRLVDIRLCRSEFGGICDSDGAQLVAVSNGLFRSTFTVPSESTLGAGNWYLEIMVGGEALTPRERLTSTAYSLFAATAASANSLFAAPGSDGVYISSNVYMLAGSVGIGTASPAAGLHVSSNNAAATSTVLLLSSGTAAGQELVVVKGDGKVGIGTASPDATLTIRAKAGYSELAFKGNGANTEIVSDGQTSINANGQLEIYSGNSSPLKLGDGITRIYIENGGDVGIGTESPAIKLDVAGGIGFYSRTMTELAAITPSAVGQAYFCSDCLPAKLVISTGTAAGNFATVVGGAFQ